MNAVTTVAGPVAHLDRADVDTDQIIPKQFLKRIERTGYGEFLFYDWVRAGEITLEAAPILVAGANFGCGSSREHAVWALQQFGFDAIVAPSFADIFAGNAAKCGLLTVAIPEQACAAIAAAGSATIDLAAQTISWTGGSASFDYDVDAKHRILNGLDEIALTLQHQDEIAAYEASSTRAG